MMPILACLLSFLLTLGLGQLLCPEAGPVAGAKSVARRPDSAPNAAVANRRLKAVRSVAVRPVDASAVYAQPTPIHQYNQ